MGRLFPGAGEFLSERLDGATWEELVRWLDYIYEAAWNGEGEWEGMQQRDPWINGPKRVRM
jgi:hypothetical protein